MIARTVDNSFKFIDFTNDFDFFCNKFRQKFFFSLFHLNDFLPEHSQLLHFDVSLFLQFLYLEFVVLDLGLKSFNVLHNVVELSDKVLVRFLVIFEFQRSQQFLWIEEGNQLSEWWDDSFNLPLSHVEMIDIELFASFSLFEFHSDVKIHEFVQIIQ